jgi:polyisoprenyl-teichoic acid--peptidoglycan teichoic acid transferase
MKNKFKRIFFIVLLLMIPLACSYPAFFQAPLASDIQGGKTQIQTRLIYAPYDATPTATPFQPLQPTAMFEPTRIPTNTPEPTFAEPEPVPTEPVYVGNYFQRPADQVNILLLGSDQRIGDPSFRTDTLILASINPSLGSVSLISFPRDLYIYIPGWTSNRINTVFNLGGFPLLQQTFEYNFAIRPDYYVMVNFDGFVRTIDSFGGIDVDVAVELTDHRDKRGKYTVEPGVQHMNGETALWYVRSRYTTSDFDRARRQQEVTNALFFTLLSLDGIKRAPEIYDIFKDTVRTDLELADITPLLPVALKIGDENAIQNYYIGPQQVSRYIVPGSGADVLLPIQYAVMDVIYQAAGIP